jgi:hypothetical protein
VGDVFEKDQEGKDILYSKDSDGELVQDPNGTERKKIERRVVTKPERWIVYFGATKEKQEVDEDFIESNFTEELIDQIKSVCSSKSAFVKIPPGDKKEHSNIPKHLYNHTAPDIHYRLAEGEKTCLVLSFASLLHYTGLKQIGSEVFNVRKKINHNIDAWKKFRDFLCSRSPDLLSQKLKPQEGTLSDLKASKLYTASLHASDGRIDHAVTIYGGWIFDSNFPKALPLTRKSLDMCCSTDNTSSSFEAFETIYMYPCFTERVDLKPDKKKKKNQKFVKVN